MPKLSAVLTNPPLSRAAHMSMHAAREAGGWLFVLALSASLASAMTLALVSARHEPEPIGASMRIESGSQADYWSCAREVVREASMLTAPDTAGPYVPDGIPDGADAWAAGKIRLDPLDANDRRDCLPPGASATANGDVSPTTVGTHDELMPRSRGTCPSYSGASAGMLDDMARGACRRAAANEQDALSGR